MDLFLPDTDKEKNLLPFDGTVLYYGRLFPAPAADDYFTVLLKTIDWKNDEAVIFGKRISTKRKVAWYGDEPFNYTYSKTTRQALPFTKELLEIKRVVETAAGEQFNSCLLNLYHSGEEGMGWHSDAEKELKKNGAIGSVSFGVARKFLFKHKKNESLIAVLLEHGSLLMMKDSTQTHWLHRLPPVTRIKQSRVNLTFRTIAS